MSAYLILFITLTLAAVAALAVFHYHRPGKKRSPEAAVAVFSAILAAGAWFATVSNQVQEDARKQAESRDAREAAHQALARADAQAAARDAILARNIEEGFRRAGLEAPASVVRDIRLRLPMVTQESAIRDARRIAVLETEQRIDRERIAAEATRNRARTQDFMRHLCQREATRNDPQCAQYRAPPPATGPLSNQLP